MSTKAEWLAEGKALGVTASTSCWEIGRWLVKGEQQFLGSEPTSKKAKKIYFAQRRENWLALIAEASKASSLADSTLRQYARVVRHGVRVEGLTFAHHIEVQRAHMTDDSQKRRFDGTAALEILNLAKAKGWNVAETRAEVQRRFPTPVVVVSAIDKAKKTLRTIISQIAKDEQLTFLDLLAAELPAMKEQIKKAAISYEDEVAEIMGIEPEDGVMPSFVEPDKAKSATASA